MIEPIFECEFEPSSYGFRPQRGCKDAQREVDELIQQGYTHVVDGDLESYFDTIRAESEESIRVLKEKILIRSVRDVLTGMNPSTLPGSDSRSLDSGIRRNDEVEGGSRRDGNSDYVALKLRIVQCS